jgi:hypothetical protein
MDAWRDAIGSLLTFLVSTALRRDACDHLVVCAVCLVPDDGVVTSSILVMVSLHLFTTRATTTRLSIFHDDLAGREKRRATNTMLVTADE